MKTRAVPPVLFFIIIAALLAVSPAKTPALSLQPPLGAGMIVSPDSTSPTGSSLWFWNEAGVFQHVVGTSSTAALTDPLNAAIPNVLGMIVSPDSTNPTGSAVWMWNDTGVYRNLAGTSTTVEISAPQGGAISNVRGMITNTDLSSPSGTGVWMWNDVGVFLHVVGTTTTAEITDPLGAAIPDVQGMIVSRDGSSPTGSAVWMWNDAGVFLHLTWTATTVEITDPLGAAIPNVREMMASTDLTSTPPRDLLWIWSDAHAYLHIPGPSINAEAAAPLTTVEITAPQGGAIPDLRGMMASADNASPTGSAVWMWNDTGVFRYVTGTLTTAEITDPLGAAIPGVQGMIVSRDGSSSAGSAVWMWNHAGVFLHLAGTTATVEITDPLGAAIPNVRGMMASTDLTSTPPRDLLWIWSDAHVYLHIPGPSINAEAAAPLTTVEITAPLGGAIPDLRGMVASMDNASPTGSAVWMWNDVGVFLYVTGTLTTVEITGPPGSPIANSWAIITSPDTSPALSAVWIRNEVGIYQNVVGSATTVEITDPLGGSIPTPTFTPPYFAVAVVKQVHDGGPGGVGVVHPPSPFYVDFGGAGLAASVHVPISTTMSPGLSTIIAAGGVQTIRNTVGSTLINDHVAVLLSAEAPPITNKGWVEGTVTDAFTGSPLEATIVALDQPDTVTTDPGSGAYRLWLDAGTHTMQASAAGYVSQTALVNIVAQQTSTQDFALLPNVPLLALSPTSLALTHHVGDVTSRKLTIANDGAAPLDFELNLLLNDLALRSKDTAAPWLATDTVSGTVPAFSAVPVNVTFDAIGLQPDTYTAQILVLSNDPFTPSTSVPVTMTVLPMTWSDICVPQRMEITGSGMGDRDHTINPQTLSLNDPFNVNWLLVQMAGRLFRDAPIPESVIFTTDAPQSLTMSAPNSHLIGYTFETHLQPTGQISATVSGVGDTYQTPRGFVLYAKRVTEALWTSVGKTTNGYVYAGLGDYTHTEVLAFPPLVEASDLTVTAVVIDNDDDTRLLEVEAAAGGVTASVTEPSPTHGEGLNIVNLTLGQVLTGTRQVSVTLRSPSDNGDSLLLVGVNVSTRCTWPVLPSVEAVTPPPNSHSASTSTHVSVTVGGLLSQTTVTPNSFLVHSGFQGRLDGVLSYSRGADSSDIAFDPSAHLHPGELLEASITRDLMRGAIPLGRSYVWQFRTAVANTGGNGRFADSDQSLGDSNSEALALGDLDGDGDLDAFVVNRAQANRVWLNDGTGTFTASGQSLGSSDSRGVALGDLDGDGDLDALVANHSGQPNKVWRNDGRGTFSDNGQRLGTSSSTDVALGDVDGDGDLDAFIGNWRQPNKVWLNDGGAQGGTPGTYSDGGQSLGSAGSSDVALGDVDADGDLDAFVANWEANTLWLNIGMGTFRDSGQSLGSSHSTSVDLGDLDGDGDLDAHVANHSEQSNAVWLNDGLGTFSASGQLLGGATSLALDLGDMDADGDLDAAVGNWMQPNRVWLNDGTGTFSASGRRLGTAYSEDLALGDLDGDGDLDVFVANWGGQANQVWFNRQPIILSSFTAAAASDRVKLMWSTAHEFGHQGFNLWRSTKANGLYARLNDTLIPAKGHAGTGASYEYFDTDVAKGIRYYYKLEDLDLYGVSASYGPVSATPSFTWRYYLPILFGTAASGH